MAFETHELERKLLLVLKILSDSREPVGARIIAKKLKENGIDLNERTVRYHLKLMDERGLTMLIGRDGRVITAEGMEELADAMVSSKVGYVLSRVELLAYQTDFDLTSGTGIVPVNISLFREEEFTKACAVMRPVFNAGLCVSHKVAVGREGQTLGDIIVPARHIGLATVCSVVINGVLLKAGVPVESRFGGILQIKKGQLRRFVELVHYAGSSLDPSEIFVRARMTAVRDMAQTGSGKVLASFRELPAPCSSVVKQVVDKLATTGINGLALVGNTGEPVCEIPVEINRVGIILYGGLNPVAAAAEADVDVTNLAMSTVMRYEELTNIKEVLV